MSEEKKADNTNDLDVVKKEDYNKVVEMHNSLKATAEKMANELKELKEKNVTKDEKASWEKEKEEIDKKLNELNRKIEDNTKVAKSVIVEKKEEKTSTFEKDKVKKMLDEKMPPSKFNPNKVASNLARYAHYKNPITKEFTNEQLGMALSLHAGVQRTSPDLMPTEAKRDKSDIIVNK